MDTVWVPFSKEFVENLSKEIDLNKIDYVIANYAESDHSGARLIVNKDWRFYDN